MNFYIDTNIFYEYFGREYISDKINMKVNHNRLYRILHSSNNNVSISSASVTEIITKFMDNPLLLKKMLKFLIDEDIEIKNHAITSYEFKDIFNMAISEQMDSFMLKKILELKLEAESSIGIVLCSLLLMVFLDFYLSREENRNEKYANLPDVEKQRLNAFIQNSLLNDRVEMIFNADTKKVKKKIGRGYRINSSNCSPLKASKVAYNQFIAQNLITITVFAENMIKNYLGEPYSTEIEDAILSNYDANKMLNNSSHVVKSVSNIIMKYRKEFSIDFVKDNKDKYLAEWNLKPIQNKYQLEYAFELITKWLQKGVKAEKNDVIDFLVIGGLDDEIFLTLDNELIGYLKTKNHKSIEYINRIIN